MDGIEIISLLVTIICLLSFSIVFTFLFRHYYLSNIDKVVNGQFDFDLIDMAVIREQEKNNKSKKVWNIIKNVFSYLFLAIVLIFFGFSVYSRATGSLISVNNTSLIVIATGSMSSKNSYNDYLFDSDLREKYNLDNQFKAYDIIGIQSYGINEEPQLYDVIAFHGKDGQIYVHRIITINDNGYVTRGDTNSISDTNQLYDGYLQKENIIGYYNGIDIPAVGIFVVFLQSNSGIITIVSIIYCLIMFEHFKNKYEDVADKRTKLLLETLEYSLDTDVEAEKKMLKEDFDCILFNGYRFTFSSNKLIKKEELGNEECALVSEHIKSFDNNDNSKEKSGSSENRFLNKIKKVFNKNKTKKD